MICYANKNLIIKILYTIEKEISGKIFTEHSSSSGTNSHVSLTRYIKLWVDYVIQLIIYVKK